MPGMCLIVVAVAAMLVVRQGSATAMVEESATVAAEEADDRPDITPQNLAGKKGFRQKKERVFERSFAVCPAFSRGSCKKGT
jgi:hypothetical protein